MEDIRKEIQYEEGSMAKNVRPSFLGFSDLSKA